MSQEKAEGVEAIEPKDADHIRYARLLQQVDLFTGLDRVTRAKLAAHLEPLTFSPGSAIVRQGEAGDAFYLVASGEVGVYAANGDAPAVQVRRLQAGEPFGEMALLGNMPRTATIVAETECQVLRLERSSFLDLVREQPSVALSIAATLSRRLAAMLERGRPDAGPKAPTAPLPQRATKPAAASAGSGSLARWLPGRIVLSLLLAGAIFTIGFLSPPPRGLTPVAWHALVALLAILPPLVMDTVLEGVLALLLACAWVLTGVAGAAGAMSGFASASWVLVVSVLIIGAAITQTGVLYRLALEAIARIRGGYVWETAALAFAGQVLGPAVPNATSRIIIIAPMLRELVDALGYRPKSKAAAGLSMAVLIGFGQLAATTLTSGTTSVLVAAILPEPFRGDINWITWTFYGVSFNLIVFAGLLLTINVLYRPPPEERRPSPERAKSLALQRALLGPMSREEKIAIGVGVALLAGFITQPWHRIDPGWIAALAVGVLSATQIVTVNTLRAVNWNFALLFGILIGLSTVFAQTGLDRWVAGGVAEVMAGLPASRVGFVVVLTLICFAVSLVVRWQASASLLTIALSPVAVAVGIHPYVVALIAVVACNGFFLPYQSTTYLAIYAGTGGGLFTHAQARPLAFAFAAWTVVAAALSVPVWTAMGLM